MELFFGAKIDSECDGMIVVSFGCEHEIKQDRLCMAWELGDDVDEDNVIDAFPNSNELSEKLTELGIELNDTTELCEGYLIHTACDMETVLASWKAKGFVYDERMNTCTWG